MGTTPLPLTVFQKCLSYVDDIQIIHEPFNVAAQTGPEGRQQTGVLEGIGKFFEGAADSASESHGWDDRVCTFQWAKDTLEAEYPEKRVVFCKDLILGIKQRYDMVPRGYRHTFLIRDPTKVMISFRKVSHAR